MDDIDIGIKEYNRDSFKGPGARFEEFRHRLPCGSEAPDFTLTDLNGTNVSLADFRGKSYVVLEFGSLT